MYTNLYSLAIHLCHCFFEHVLWRQHQLEHLLRRRHLLANQLGVPDRSSRRIQGFRVRVNPRCSGFTLIETLYRWIGLNRRRHLLAHQLGVPVQVDVLDSRAGRGNPKMQKPTGHGAEEFGSKQKQSLEEEIPEGGPIPLHRDTTRSIDREYLSISIHLSTSIYPYVLARSSVCLIKETDLSTRSIDFWP